MTTSATTRVLVVDDNLMNRELAVFVLDAAGFAVTQAEDATQALSALAQPPLPDAILMDIQMPGMDGLELTRRLKADPATAGVCVIAFTAHAMKGEEARMLEAGCDGYISKPIDIKRLAQQGRQALASRPGT